MFLPRSILSFHSILLMPLVLIVAGCGGGSSGFGTLPDAPDVSIVGVSTSPKQVVITVSVNPNGDTTDIWIEFGTDDDFGQSSTVIPIGNGKNGLIIDQQLDALLPNTTYYYRVIAKSGLHMVETNVRSFTTSPVPLPDAQTVYLLNIQTASVQGCTLHGAVNPNGFLTSAWFEWGLDSNYGTQTQQQTLGDGTILNDLIDSLNSVGQSDTLFHYRAVAQNEGGISYGEDAVCTTPPDTTIDDPSLDTDGDGLNNSEEVNTYGTSPTNPDSDADGLTDGSEINDHFTNPLDPDTDNDGLTDGDEIDIYDTNPNSADSDGDGLNDYTEINDYNSNPNNPDSDGDGLKDGAEIVTHATDPNDNDSDDDGLEDGEEVNIYNTNPDSPDSDGDGLTDAEEVLTYNSDPNDADSDDDGLTDGEEVNEHHTDPNNPDTDGDGIDDYVEIQFGKDPTVADSETNYPDLVVESLSGPLGALSNQTVTITDTIANIDVIEAMNFKVAYFLSQDAGLDNSDILMGVRTMSLLSPLQSDTATTSVTIPTGLAEGVYYLVAVVDFPDTPAMTAGNVLESDEDNNILFSAETISIGHGFDSGDASDGDLDVDLAIADTFNLTTDSSNAWGNSDDDNGDYPDGFATLLSADAARGTTTVTVDSTAGFATGDEIMIIQLIHDNDHGLYEFQKNISVTNGTTLALSTPLGRTYHAMGNTTNTVQVIRVPHYSTLTVFNTTKLTTSTFNISTRLGGIVVFRTDSLVVESGGSINADGLGFPGGASHMPDGKQGWSYTGQGSVAQSANAGGGGSGMVAPFYYLGGGGGGHSDVGERGKNSVGGHQGGLGGNQYGDPLLNRIYPGSGGGSGAAQHSAASSGSGGNGGGIIYIDAGTTMIYGTVSADGQNGGNSETNYFGGSGGGGSGGSIYLSAVAPTITGSMTATGGAGGTTSGTPGEEWGVGGTGGPGQIYMPDPASAAPDLVMASVTGPTSATSGETVSVLTTVTNVLPVDVSDPFKVGIYLSIDQQISTGDIYLGERLLGGLPGDGSDTALTEVTIPSGLESGSVYYLGAIADHAGEVSELNENNNGKIQLNTLILQ